MAATVLVDTNVLIDFERGNKETGQSLDEIEGHSKLAISAMTQMEMIAGRRNKPELRILQSFLRRFDIVPFNATITTKTIDILLQYKLSHGLLIADALIAATAMTTQAPLLTANQRDFRFIEALSLFPYRT